MEGSESPEGSSNSSRSISRGGSGHLGVNKQYSGKISKVVKQRSVIQTPRQQAPVYTIDKNDFRNIVQRLTGSPAAAEQPAAAPQPPPPASSAPSPRPLQNPNNPNQNQNANTPRLQRIRPPPLQSVFSFNKLVPNLKPMTSISFPSLHQPPAAPTTTTTINAHNFVTPNFSTATNFATVAPNFNTGATNFNPAAAISRPVPSFQFPSTSEQQLSALAPSAAVYAAPVVQRPPVSHMTVPFGFAPPPQQQYNFSAPFAHQTTSLGSHAAPSPPPYSPLFLTSPAAAQSQFPLLSPLPSPGSQFALSQFVAGSQVPLSPGSLFPLSPPGQFGFPGGMAGQLNLPPPSPSSLFPLSPAAQFPFNSF